MVSEEATEEILYLVNKALGSFLVLLNLLCSLFVSVAVRVEVSIVSLEEVVKEMVKVFIGILLHLVRVLEVDGLLSGLLSSIILLLSIQSIFNGIRGGFTESLFSEEVNEHIEGSLGFLRGLSVTHVSHLLGSVVIEGHLHDFRELEGHLTG